MALHDTPAPVTEPGVLQLAEHAAQSIRELNHRTRDRDAIADPAELCWLLADLAAVASRLPQLLDQLGSWLRHEHDTGRMRADNDDPGEIAYLTDAELTRASQCAHHLADTTGQRSPARRPPGHRIATRETEGRSTTNQGGQLSTAARGSVFSRC